MALSAGATGAIVIGAIAGGEAFSVRYYCCLSGTRKHRARNKVAVILEGQDK